MDEKKKINNNAKRIFYLLIFIFSFLYIAGETGYYETNLNNKTIITKEAIKEFEQDVLDGREVDLKDYIKTTNEEYDSKVSSLGLKISNSIEYILNDGINWLSKIIKTLFS